MAPLVSVCVITYNHEAYIAKALDSILSQKEVENLEVCILEDCSTDKTLEIIKEYERRFPEVIRVFSNSKNKGDFLNFRDGFKNVRGDYVAFLEGDDYYTDDYKLNKQVSFLEKNPEYVGSSHNIIFLYKNGEQAVQYPNEIRKDYILQDIMTGKFYFHTASFVYRNIFKGGFPKEYYIPEAGDWYLSMLFSEHGAIRYFSETMSAYRIHGEGIWSGLTPIQRRLKNIDGVAVYNKMFNFKYSHIFSRFSYDIGGLIVKHFREMSSMEIIKYLSLFVSLLSGKINCKPMRLLVGNPTLNFYFKLHKTNTEGSQ